LGAISREGGTSLARGEQRRSRLKDELEDEWDEQFWEPLPGHELVFTPAGELYGHRGP
jgi:hypothetical protein